MGNSKESFCAKGVYAALLTPRRQTSIEADAAALLDYLDVIVQEGVDGLVLFGSTGEFVHFDVSERMRVLGLAIRRSRVPVLVNVSHSTLAGALDLAENAVSSGASGLLLMPPYFFRYSDDQIFEYYQQFLKAVGGRIPIYLYNLPFYTNPISNDLADRLLSSGNFAGIKDSSGDWQAFELLLALSKKSAFQLFVGNEAIYLRGRVAGAAGIVSGVAAAIPELVVAIDRAVQSSHLDRAQRLNFHLEEFVERLQKFPATTAIKQAAIARDWLRNYPALPLDEDTAADLIAFHQWFRIWLPGVLAACADNPIGTLKPTGVEKSSG